jgi:serpin B
VESNTTFGLNLYGQLAASPGNLFFSPYSISTCLAMTYAGARGNTEAQMAQVFGFDTNQEPFAATFGKLQRDIETGQWQNGVELNLANALWTQAGYKFLPGFLDLAQSEYQANLHQANFATQANEAIDAINRWVEQKTNDKIQDILPPGSLTALTRLVLANAIYFKGTWAKPFEKPTPRASRSTSPAPTR